MKRTSKPVRFLALLGAIVLAGLYVTTLVSAIINTAFTQTLFQACLYLTLTVPVLIYGLNLVMKAIYGNRMNSDKSDPDNNKE